MAARLLAALIALAVCAPAVAQVPNQTSDPGFRVGARRGDRIGDSMAGRDARVATTPKRLDPGANPSKPPSANASGYVELPNGLSVYNPGMDASGR